MRHTPLHHAAELGHCTVAQWLLENGADVNAHDERMIDETALCLAAKGNSPEVVELLLRHGADPDIPGWVGLTARMRAQRRTDDTGRTIAALIDRRQPLRPKPKAQG